MKNEKIFIIRANPSCIGMYDDGAVIYGLLRTTKNQKELQKIIDEYVKNNDYYNEDGLQEILRKEKDIEILRYDEVVF